MNTVLTELVSAVRDVGRITFVTPVREGRPRPSGWPRGLREIGLATLVVFTLLMLATLFAVPLRQAGELTLSPSTPTTLPTVTMPLLLVGVLLSLVLVGTAALHVSWWLRLVLLVLVGSAITFFMVRSWTSPVPLAIAAVSYLALVVFTVLRARSGFAWWEVVVVAALLLGATVLPWAIPVDGPLADVDIRPATLQGALVTLQPLILPAVIVAGSAPAQIVVTGAQATASRPVGRWLFAAGFALSVAWLAVATWQGLGSDAFTGTAFGGAVVALLATAAVVAVWLRRAGSRTPPQPARYPEVWGAWLYPLAIAMALLVVITFPVILARGVATLAGLPQVAGALDTALAVFNDNNPGVLARGALGVVLLVIAGRLSTRSRLAEAVALTAFAVLVLMDLAGLVPALRFLQDRSTEAIGLLASVLALGAAVVALVRRRFDQATAVGVMTVVLLTVLYPHRNLLSDPLGFALAFSGPVVLVFGLAWRVFTEAQVTYSGSPRYPQSTRVLLFLANALFATTGVAFTTLSRGLGTDADPSAWGVLGDSALGDPLFLTGLVAGLWLLLRPHRGAETTPLPTDADVVAAEAHAEGDSVPAMPAPAPQPVPYGPHAGRRAALPLQYGPNASGGVAASPGGQPAVAEVADDGRPVGLDRVHPEVEDGTVDRLR